MKFSEISKLFFQSKMKIPLAVITSKYFKIAKDLIHSIPKDYWVSLFDEADIRSEITVHSEEGVQFGRNYYSRVSTSFRTYINEKFTDSCKNLLNKYDLEQIQITFELPKLTLEKISVKFFISTKYVCNSGKESMRYLYKQCFGDRLVTYDYFYNYPQPKQLDFTVMMYND